MPARLRIRLRPPSQPTRYFARNDLAVGQLDVDAGVVLGKARHFAFAVDRHRQLVDPAGQDALDVLLRQREPVVVASRKVADVERDHREARDLHDLPLRQEALGDASLIEHLDRACMQAARARAGEVLVGAPLDDGDVDTRQRQLARQHQPRRASSCDHHRMVRHGQRLCGTTRGLPQAPVSGINLRWRGAGTARPSGPGDYTVPVIVSVLRTAASLRWRLRTRSSSAA